MEGDLNWNRLAAAGKNRFHNLDERRRFSLALLMLYRVPYRWGEETPDGADCSGSICFALAAATGRVLRTTADGLFREVFTVSNPGNEDTQALFFVTQENRTVDNHLVNRGTVMHIAGIVANGIVMNVVEPVAELRIIDELVNSYDRMGYDTIRRGLDQKAYGKLSKPIEECMNLDAKFHEFFEEGEI